MNIIVLGGSGYIGKNLLEEYEKKGSDNNWSFYSRRGSRKNIKYHEIRNIPKSDIIIDFSQRAIIGESKTYGEIKKEEQRIYECMNQCDRYIYISTTNINIERTEKSSKGTFYTNYKRHFERYIGKMREVGKNVCCVRIPLVFSDPPKDGTVIDKIVSKLRGKETNFRNQDSKITAIHTKDLMEKLEYITTMEYNNDMYNKKLLISEEYIYSIRDIVSSLSAEGRPDNNYADNRSLLDKDGCYHLKLRDKKFFCRIKELT